MTASCTVVVIAQNEAANIERCVRSAVGVGEVVVVDGGSVDDTVELARAAGAQVVHNPFVYAAQQYNFALDRVETEWAFILDADEVIDEELRETLTSALVDPSVSSGWAAARVRRRNFFTGVEMRHGGWYPDYNFRLLRVGAARYEDRRVHARVIFDGGFGTLTGHLLHDTYVSVPQYIAKMNKFTDREVLARQQPVTSTELRARVRALWLRTPGKPFTRFFVAYVVRRGFLDGRIGFDVAVLRAQYELFASLKARRPPASMPDPTPSDERPARTP